MLVTALGPKVTNDTTYSVTGTLSPDATGSYVEYGDYNGNRYIRRIDGGYFIWWDDTDTWTLSVLLGVQGTAYWTRVDPSIEGVYVAQGTATGVPTVAET